MSRLSISRLILLTALAVGSAAPSSAQVYEGLFELGGTASFTNTSFDNGSVTVLQVAPTVGYFLTDALEAGVQLRYSKVENRDGNGDLTVFTAYHFGRRGATTVPFLRAQIGTNLTGGNSDLVFGGAGGAKFFFLPGGALTGEGFLLTTGDVTSVGAAVGVSIFF